MLVTLEMLRAVFLVGGGGEGGEGGEGGFGDWGVEGKTILTKWDGGKGPLGGRHVPVRQAEGRQGDFAAAERSL